MIEEIGAIPYKISWHALILLILFSGFVCFGFSFCTVFTFCVSR